MSRAYDLTEGVTTLALRSILNPEKYPKPLTRWQRLVRWCRRALPISRRIEAAR